MLVGYGPPLVVPAPETVTAALNAPVSALGLGALAEAFARRSADGPSDSGETVGRTLDGYPVSGTAR